jgi:hypothetical protein
VFNVSCTGEGYTGISNIQCTAASWDGDESFVISDNAPNKVVIDSFVLGYIKGRSTFAIRQVANYYDCEGGAHARVYKTKYEMGECKRDLMNVAEVYEALGTVLSGCSKQLEKSWT